MYDGGKILIGLGAFVFLLSIPFWFSAATGGATGRPELETPKGERCVEDVEYMRAAHMDLLSEWRDLVVREGQRTYVAKDGTKHEMSLTKNCLSCHQSRERFCNRCHDYVDMKPYCWDCHVEPKGE
jgi:hypothetical protein